MGGIAMNPDEGVSRAAVRLALDCGATAIVAMTRTGYTARMLSKYKPCMTIVAITRSNIVRRQLAAVRGVHALPIEIPEKIEGGTNPLIATAVSEAKRVGIVDEGDFVVVVDGAPGASGPGGSFESFSDT